MKERYILISFLKFIAIIFFTLIVTFIMAKLLPPPKGTAFDGLDYVLKPIFISLISGFIYLVLSLTQTKHEQKFLLAALLINFIYVVLVYLKVM